MALGDDGLAARGLQDDESSEISAKRKVGAGLPAIAVGQPTYPATDTQPSQASQLPHLTEGDLESVVEGFDGLG